LGARIHATVGGVLVIAFVAASFLGIFFLARVVPLDSLATPTPICMKEIAVVVAIFLILVSAMQPIRDVLDRSRSPISRFLRHGVELPRPIRVVAVVLLVGGFFAFAFWATADVLGGYNGYGYSFAVHPILRQIYDNTIGLVPYISSRDKGTQASFYLSLAVIGFLALRLNRGVGAALKDAITLFAAPCLVIFELGVWIYAPEDMTWHVTDYLWMGGTADGGYRAFDTGGAYLVSNWLVLCVELLLVASRIPGLSLPSRKIWGRGVTER
jgi:hypothetical protein